MGKYEIFGRPLPKRLCGMVFACLEQGLVVLGVNLPDNTIAQLGEKISQAKIKRAG